MILCDLKCYDPKIYNGYLVPCGKCYACKLKRSNDWSIRLRQEYLNKSNKCLFITFTYEDNCLNLVSCPDYLSPDDKQVFDNSYYKLENGIAVLSKRDIQLFNKRARHVLPDFTFFLVGEYGPTTLRPHYHALYFGLDMSCYDVVSRLWTKGYVKISLVSPGRIAYVSKYSLLPQNLPEFLLKKEYKPFMMCSKGIGIQFLQNPQVIDMFNSDDKLYIQDGKYKKSLPRYYKQKIFSKEKLERFAREYKEKTQDMLQDAYELEKNKTEFARQIKQKKDWVEQHRYLVEQKMLKKPKI